MDPAEVWQELVVLATGVEFKWWALSKGAVHGYRPAPVLLGNFTDCVS